MENFIYWCNQCKVPIIKTEKGNFNCRLCNEKLKYISADLRPVFPQEKIMLELLLGKNFKDIAIWKGRTRYYVDGISLQLPNQMLLDTDIKKLRKALLNTKSDYERFNQYINLFIKANQEHYNEIKDEAIKYIQEQTQTYMDYEKMVSFSGGKDSTVVSDLVIRALNDKSIKHLFGDTTLEHKCTYEYIRRLKRNKLINLHIARNTDSKFYDIAKKIGPPSRVSRWCCYMFKTGPVNRLMTTLFGNKKVLTFYGIRKSESVARSKYKRTEENSEHKKIMNQVVCSPIFYWKDIDIWLYIFTNNLDFNKAYKFGYSRVGCWCCPNASVISEFLAKIYMKKEYERWNHFLINFAKAIGKENPEEYINTGGWKARQGGAGLEEAKSVKIVQQNCTVQENGKIYDLSKPINDRFFQLFIPFGKVIDGDKVISEKLVLDIKTLVPIISLQKISDYKIKIITLNVKNHKSLHQNIFHQIMKFNACKQCLKCEGVCMHNAIHLDKEGYSIDEKLCKHCQMCVSSKYIPGGCMMCRYLRTRR